MTDSDDQLGTMLTRIDPYAGSSPSSHELASASVAVAHAVVAADRAAALQARRAKRRNRLVALALAGTVVVPTSAWAGYHFAAQSGLFGAPGMTENDTSEFIDVCASDFPDFFATLAVPSDAPPSGLTWRQVGDRIVATKKESTVNDCPPKGPGLMEQTTGLKSQYYLYAQDVWICRALRDRATGDDAGFRSNAALAATTMDRLDAMGIYGDDNWQPFRDALKSGDTAVINQFYEANRAREECQ